ncbi:MAG: IS200/IS605 family transposase [Terriglobales bacterium]
MPHSLCSLHTHVVFSTKDRLPTIHDEFRSDLFAYLGGIVRGLDGKAVIINGMRDHVHMLIKLSATLAVADCMRFVKANSSKWLRQNGHPKFAWQNGYAAFSVSTSNLPHVTNYIREQERHHRRMSFQQELVRLLEKHGVIYHERYLWR